MAPSYIVAIVGLLAAVLPLLDIHVAPEALTNTITVLALLFVAIRQKITGRSTFAGFRPRDFTESNY